jgi:hypothetical protein
VKITESDPGVRGFSSHYPSRSKNTQYNSARKTQIPMIGRRIEWLKRVAGRTKLTTKRRSKAHDALPSGSIACQDLLMVTCVESAWRPTRPGFQIEAPPSSRRHVCMATCRLCLTSRSALRTDAGRTQAISARQASRAAAGGAMLPWPYGRRLRVARPLSGHEHTDQVLHMSSWRGVELTA